MYVFKLNVKFHILHSVRTLYYSLSIRIHEVLGKRFKKNLKNIMDREMYKNLHLLLLEIVTQNVLSSTPVSSAPFVTVPAEPSTI